MQIHFHVRMHLQHQHSRGFFVTEQGFCFELVKQIKIKILHHGTVTIVKQRRIFEVVTVGTHHDCEENEIVKWFPFYEGDAMFPAQICYLMFPAQSCYILKILFKCTKL